MKARRRFAALAILLSAGFWGLHRPAAAAAIIDTGVIPCSGSTCGDLDLSYTGSIAGRFGVSAPTPITSLEAWISLGLPPSFSLTMVIYGNGTDGLPGILPYFSSPVSIFDHPGAAQGSFGDQWQGLSGLNLVLQPGTYWLALEVHPGDHYNGYAPSSELGFGPIVPADAYARLTPVSAGGTGLWHATSNGFAFRVLAPEPSLLALCAIALAVGLRRSTLGARRDPHRGASG
jgi:hypothetical protein